MKCYGCKLRKHLGLKGKCGKCKESRKLTQRKETPDFFWDIKGKYK